MTARFIAQCTFVISTLLFQACVPPGGSAGGSCTLSNGDIANTYAIFGKWKKIDGYEGETSPRTEKTLNLNYDVLVVEPGTRICAASFANGTPNKTLFRGDYDHDIDNQRVTISYTDGEKRGSSTSASYSFSGSCNDTHMILNYDDGSYEVYENYSFDVQVGDCDPQPQ